MGKRRAGDESLGSEDVVFFFSLALSFFFLFFCTDAFLKVDKIGKNGQVSVFLLLFLLCSK